MTRYNDMIDKIEKRIIDSGITDKRIVECEQITDYHSYFEFLIDYNLGGGNNEPSPNEIWDLMKSYINLLTRNLLKASSDYNKLQKDHRNLTNDYYELIKEKS